MTLFVEWTDEATEDLLGILDYIAERNVSASERINALIQHTAERLPDHPYIHRPGRVPGTREAIVHPNYILVYRVGEAAIEVVAVLHARQQYP
ncbi:type II toxin-antitoxin system RelE/ParE family toxin [Sphingomonas immobilis]|uniref:Type II toxin-antitoxin system RelE/ParE family toxin n=1 Tax=Sphingomonas immobilis TaxID=3063997 RepID=A0ABT9A0A6_9SPHN|nr:type II toxin-antitoxin system RelE/ParE family toxin [Sphingomonas sp. CA1-15]MDO7843270.1 type II toxin-antitoxin system RelE/ParE family toxin [Sphingomonas sp. CA1-15]